MTYKTEWNFSLLYKNEKDPRIESDVRLIENACARFERKYKPKGKIIDFTSTPEKLAKALKDHTAFSETLEDRSPIFYFWLKSSKNSKDEFANAQLAKYEQRLTKAGNRLAFFFLEIAKIPKNIQSVFLKHPLLKDYTYLLKTTFDTAKYNLTELEEQLENLLAQTSYSMWVNGQEKLLNEQVVDWKGEKMPISKAMGIFSDLPKKDRHELYDKINSTLKSISHFAEAEINAVYSYKKVMDEKRGLKKPYTGTVLRYENTEKNIELLVSLVTKYFSISKRFYKIHAKLLGEEKLKYADRGAKIGEIKKKFDFDTSVEIVKNTFEKIDPRYKAYLESYLENGQIDVYPKVGKSGGAFCTSEGKMPTFVLLNHSDDIRSVETLAHEMGHAIHSELTRPQPPHYRGVSMATAEVASTFFEQVVVEELENQLDDKEKIIFLDNKIRGDISTIFRQIACFNFELELHKEIREKGYVPKEDIAKIMSKHMKAYLGDSVEVTDENGYFFVAWSHIRNFFYVYSYAYGQIVSRALFENWKKDKSYAKKIEQFLSSGRSASPEQIFKKIGIDTSKPEFFEAGLKSVEKDIARLEKLARKR